MVVCCNEPCSSFAMFIGQYICEDSSFTSLPSSLAGNVLMNICCQKMSSSSSSQAYEATDAKNKTSTTPKDKESRLPKAEKIECPPAPKRPPPKSGHNDSFSPLDLNTRWC